MTKSETFTQIAMSLEGTQSAPHFDRTAFKVRRIYATLAADRMSANLKFTPDEQEFKRAVAPDLFSAIPNGWGRQGWTALNLERVTADDIRAALVMAHAHGAALKAPK